jgi:hypothetical protein
MTAQQQFNFAVAIGKISLLLEQAEEARASNRVEAGIPLDAGLGAAIGAGAGALGGTVFAQSGRARHRRPSRAGTTSPTDSPYPRAATTFPASSKRGDGGERRGHLALRHRGTGGRRLRHSGSPCPIRFGSQGWPPLVQTIGPALRLRGRLGDSGRLPLGDRGVPMITLRLQTVADRVQTFSVWLTDPGHCTPLPVGFVREDLRTWFAKTREGYTDIRAGFRSRAEAATWILVQGGFAQQPRPPVAELRVAV